MDFENILYEGVIYTPKLKKIRNQLTSILLRPSTLFKIRSEIEDNWRINKLVLSNILVDEATNVLKKIYNIYLVYDYKIDSSAQFQFDENGQHIIYINFNHIAKTDMIYDHLVQTGTIESINNFVIRFINLIVHELIHYYQADSRIEKLDPDEMFYQKTRSDKKYKRENFHYYYMNDKDEMMAFAAEIIADLKDKGYSQKDILNLISQDEDVIYNIELYDFRRFNKKIKLENWNTFLKYLYKYTTEYYEEM